MSNLKRPDGLKVLHELIAFEWRAHRAVWLSLIALIFGVSILFGIWTASAENWIVSVLSYALSGHPSRGSCNSCARACSTNIKACS